MPRTAWHPLFYLALQAVAPPGKYVIHSEFTLAKEPQRADFIIIEQVGALHRQVRHLRCVFDRLGEHTLIELKGPTDDADGDDFFVLMSHAWQYARMAGLTQADRLRLMVVANRLTAPFRERCAEHGRHFVEEERGIWVSEEGPHVIYFIESMKMDDAVTSLFSKRFLSDPEACWPDTEDEMNLVLYLMQQVEQLRGSGKVMRLKDWNELTRSQESLARKIVEAFPREKLLSFFEPEERLRGLDPEEVFGHYPLEERLRGLDPEEVFGRYSPEEMARALSPEQKERLKKLLH